ncbi:DUF998 domain-containing protein [Nocardia sp. NPDC088792]|uniref:DUF998 domain-containing protein n=1 Tax=Nocardia sp. NPDC088792 TaxID=3364332 RepID=UPI00380DEA2D
MKVQKLGVSLMDVIVQKATVRMRFAGALLLLAGVQYVVLEYVAAAAWPHPGYSYVVNFISDLGNPVADDVYAGRLIDSPHHVAMNIAFVAQGALFLIAGVLLLTSMIRGRLDRLLLGLVIAHSVGVILVGFFHESSANEHNGVLLVHGIGAAATILAGNIVAIVVGVQGAKFGVAQGLRWTFGAVGILGLASFVLLQADRPLYDSAGGVPERGAVYSILLFEIVLGTALLVRGTCHAPVSSVQSVRERLTS